MARGRRAGRVKLFVFGLGYSAQAFVAHERASLDGVSATVTGAAKAEALAKDGLKVHVFDGTAADPAIAADVATCDAILASVPPDADGDPVLRIFEDAIVSARTPRWIGYLSTVGVYGDHGGAWVDENSETRPANERSRHRLHAERAWLRLGERAGKAVHIFRLAGIYGPGSNALVNVRAGRARRIVKPGQVFNRIHVDDIAAVLAATLSRSEASEIWNVADDEPSPPQDVIVYAAELLGVPPPPVIAFEDTRLTGLALSFWQESKRVCNRRIRDELKLSLAHPNYRDGLQALMKVDGQKAP
jgi:nucleoside-diphosphate-sugar epimerase